MRLAGRLVRMADRLAEMAIEGVRDGMVVGLGTGRAATRGIRALAARVDRERLKIECVATSRKSEEIAHELGLRVRDMRDVGAVDLLFDGADEVNEQLVMLKGGGGAMVREKIVARASARNIYMVQEKKIVKRIGEGFRLPVEVLRFGLASTVRWLGAQGLEGTVRVGDGADGLFVTDEGNAVVDVELPEALGERWIDRFLNDHPAVVGHGLFLDEASVVLVEDEGGEVRTLER